METEMKPWKDEGGHLLGWVRRNGSGIRQLMLLRQAVDLQAAEPADIDVMAIVEGGPVLEIKCSLCGEVRTWYPDSEQLERLLMRVAAMRQQVEMARV